MKLWELWKVLDDIHPLWINMDGESDFFENKNEVGVEYARHIVEYITQDGEDVLTIELKRTEG